MAHSCHLSLSLVLLLCLLFLSAPCSFAQRGGQPQQQRAQTQCQINRINAEAPHRRIQSEGGVTEVWNLNEDQFQCAGVAPLRHRLHPRGLLLPHYNNAPQLMYVVRGRGVHGAVFPGCAETFQSEAGQAQKSEYRESRGGRGGSAPRDQHQKIRRIREGDVVAFPAGTTYWVYNDADSELVLNAIIDVGNVHNQLDQNFRRFFLAGNPQEDAVSGGPSFERERESESERVRLREGGRGNQAGNILSGFDTQLLSEALNIDPQLARRLQNRDDMRGSIIRVEKELELVFPEYQEEEQERRRRGYNDNDNGLEETLCSMKLRHQLDQASRADVFNPRAGRLSSVNRFNLPILQYIQLSAERGVLYRNAIYSPHWNMNSHSIVFITGGNGSMQIVREDGETVFNGRVEEGQVITVPQQFAVIKRANEQGLEWVAFKTNDNAKISQVAGRVSVLRAIPIDVLRNAFKISNDEAWRLKVNRDQEVSLFSPTSRRSSRYAIEA